MNLLDFASDEAKRQGVDPSLVLRVIQQESGGNPSAVSPKGARGPMQLMAGTARDMGVNPADPVDNIRGGVRYLKKQLDTFGDPHLALAAYNAGPAAVRRAGGVPNFRETQGYVRSIMGSGQPQSGADIFGDPQPPAPPEGVTPQGAELQHGADIFADSAPDPSPAPAPPVPASAPQLMGPPRVSQQLGFEQGIAKPAANLGNWLDGAAQHLGIDTSGIHQMADRLQAAQGKADASEPWRRTAIPGKVGQFAGNIAGTAMLPGGPMTSGALTGVLLSDKSDAPGVLGDAAAGLIGGKLGASVVGGLGKFAKGLTGDALLLAQKGVPLTPGQMAGGFVKGAEDKLTSVPVIGDVIRSAQRRGMAGANRAGFNDTLAKIGEALPDHIDVGHDAYTYTKQRLGDVYDEVLAPLTVARDQPWSQALTAAKADIAKIGDPTVRSHALNVLKTSVQSRFDNAGNIVGQDLKDVQSDLGSHINDLMQGKTWERKAGQALSSVKGALEDLVSRTDPAAGERLAQVNAGWAHLKPLESAVAKAGVKDGGIFTMNQMAQGVTRGKAASTVAAGRAPHQELAGAAARLLPSSVPDSGTAGRLMGPAVLAGLLSGHLPMTAAAAPVAVPAAGLIGGMAALYTRGGQKALTAMMSSRNPAARTIGEHLRLLANPAGSASAVALSGARQ